MTEELLRRFLDERVDGFGSPSRARTGGKYRYYPPLVLREHTSFTRRRAGRYIDRSKAFTSDPANHPASRTSSPIRSSQGRFPPNCFLATDDEISPLSGILSLQAR